MHSMLWTKPSRWNQDVLSGTITEKLHEGRSTVQFTNRLKSWNGLNDKPLPQTILLMCHISWGRTAITLACILQFPQHKIQNLQQKQYTIFGIAWWKILYYCTQKQGLPRSENERGCQGWLLDHSQGYIDRCKLVRANVPNI